MSYYNIPPRQVGRSNANNGTSNSSAPAAPQRSNNYNSNVSSNVSNMSNGGNRPTPMNGGSLNRPQPQVKSIYASMYNTSNVNTAPVNNSNDNVRNTSSSQNNSSTQRQLIFSESDSENIVPSQQKAAPRSNLSSGVNGNPTTQQRKASNAPNNNIRSTSGYTNRPTPAASYYGCSGYFNHFQVRKDEVANSDVTYEKTVQKQETATTVSSNKNTNSSKGAPTLLELADSDDELMLAKTVSKEDNDVENNASGNNKYNSEHNLRRGFVNGSMYGDFKGSPQSSPKNNTSSSQTDNQMFITKHGFAAPPRGEKSKYELNPPAKQIDAVPKNLNNENIPSKPEKYASMYSEKYVSSAAVTEKKTTEVSEPSHDTSSDDSPIHLAAVEGAEEKGDDHGAEKLVSKITTTKNNPSTKTESNTVTPQPIPDPKLMPVRIKSSGTLVSPTDARFQAGNMVNKRDGIITEVGRSRTDQIDESMADASTADYALITRCQANRG